MRPLAAVLLLCSLWAGAVPAAAAEDLEEIERQLKGRIKGKVVTLRKPFRGDNLRFDREGSPVADSPEGHWTSYAEVEIGEVRVKAHSLQLDGTRLLVADLGPPRGFTHVRTDEKVRIEIETRPGETTLAEATAALARVFVTDEEFSGTGVAERLGSYFSSQQDTAALDSLEPNDAEIRDRSKPVYVIDKNTTAPMCVFCLDPQYTEEARRAKLEGAIILSCVVNAGGEAERIRVRKPLGKGLDEEAVKAVQKWRFKPALREGRSVAVYMVIEINFRLH